jgi:hypothetical protein
VSDHVSEPADLHPTDQLAPMLAGELTLDELRTVVVHVRRCPNCQAELVEVAAGYGALQGVAREGLDDLAEPPPLAVHPIEVAPVRPVPPLVDDGSTGSTSARAQRSGLTRIALGVVTAAAAVVLVLSGVVVGTRLDDDGGQFAAPTTTVTSLPTASVVLNPLGDIDAAGSVSMYDVAGTGGAEQIMTVDTSELPPAEPGTFYEVWLLQPDTNQMLAVGVLPDSGVESYAIPAAIVANYQAVDISLQRDDGSIVHSGDSYLRATYA